MPGEKVQSSTNTAIKPRAVVFRFRMADEVHIEGLQHRSGAVLLLLFR